MSTEGKAALSARFGDRIVSFTGRHQKYLQRHWARFAAAESPSSRESLLRIRSAEQ
jgi:hypothetical protein